MTSIVWAIATRNWKKSARRPVTLAFSLVQPMFWILFFGFLMHRFPLTELPAQVSYVSFLVPGICAMTVLFGASQAGVSLIRDLQTGFLQRMLAAPAPRWALHMGKIASDGARLLAQAAVVLLLGLAVGASLLFAPFPLFTGFLGLFFFALAFGSLSCIIALRSKRAETLATFVHLVNMPIFFTSTALVPHKQMPEWLAAIAQWNPLTLVVEGLREPLLFGSMPDLAGHLVPLMGLATFLVVWAVAELQRGTSVSSWEAK